MLIGVDWNSKRYLAVDEFFKEAHAVIKLLVDECCLAPRWCRLSHVLNVKERKSYDPNAPRKKI